MYYTRLSFFDTFKACFLISMIVGTVLAPKILKRYNEQEKLKATQAQVMIQEQQSQQQIELASAAPVAQQSNF